MKSNIWIFGHGKNAVDAFENGRSMQRYIRDISTSEYDYRYRYSKKQENAKVVLLSFDGTAYGHFEVVRTEPPTPADILKFRPVRNGCVYIVKNPSVYADPVRLFHKFDIRVGHQPYPISETVFEEIIRAAGEVATEYKPPSREEKRKRVLAEIADRQGQGPFRDDLLEAYGTHCAITDCDAENALEACHIDPYVSEESNDVRNGLLLRADIHTLFDLKLLAINLSTFKVALAPKLLETSYNDLQGQPLKLPVEAKHHPDLGAIKRRWEFFKDRKKK